ncbi:hypothetical protein D3C87_1726040 [compost metagenome]
MAATPTSWASWAFAGAAAKFGAHHRLVDGVVRDGLHGAFMFGLRGVAAAAAGKTAVGVERIAE